MTDVPAIFQHRSCFKTTLLGLCVFLGLVSVVTLISLVIQLTVTIVNIGTLVPNINDMILETKNTARDAGALIASVNKILPVFDTISGELLHGVNSVDLFVSNITNNMYVYNNAISAVSKINFTLLQNDIDSITYSISNLTALTNRVANYFHI